MYLDSPKETGSASPRTARSNRNENRKTVAQLSKTTYPTPLEHSSPGVARPCDIRAYSVGPIRVFEWWASHAYSRQFIQITRNHDGARSFAMKQELSDMSDTTLHAAFSKWQAAREYIRDGIMSPLFDDETFIRVFRSPDAFR